MNCANSDFGFLIFNIGDPPGYPGYPEYRGDRGDIGDTSVKQSLYLQ